jgi:hypothetical protein
MNDFELRLVKFLYTLCYDMVPIGTIDMICEEVLDDMTKTHNENESYLVATTDMGIRDFCIRILTQLKHGKV